MCYIASQLFLFFPTLARFLPPWACTHLAHGRLWLQGGCRMNIKWLLHWLVGWWDGGEGGGRDYCFVFTLMR